MENIIASTYQIIREIGSGGGGVVYLGKHLRLNKPVVLKADKRTLSAPQEALRREVDALKNMTHTYIPQVYDFVVQEGVVYTVMDYIDGESLDKPLERGERFSQPQAVAWARQLLEALCYLHSRPPHGILHGDIKPANIMWTPQGDIRLIDFNIALALGEEGAVRVGFSRGYASPEHYGLDYSSFNTTQRLGGRIPDGMPAGLAATEIVSDDGSAAGHRTILLDVRSDIYSLGATLYHIFTGRRPDSDAKKVEPIVYTDGVSVEVAKIIQKAMAPAPEDRYQTAEEMLYAFTHLHENDIRTKRHKRRVRVTACVLAALFLAGGLSAFTGLKQMEQAQELKRIAAETSEQALAMVSASERAYQNGDVPGAVRLALEALDLESAYQPRAQKALTDALGVYELFDAFQPYRSLTLPSAPMKIALSPAGSRAAAIVSGQMLAFDMESGEPLAALPADSSALSDVAFLGEDTLVYAGDGALRAYDLIRQQELWSGKAATGISVSSDGSAVAAVYKDENIAAVYDARTGEALQAVPFGNRHQAVLANDVFADPEDCLFALNGDGSWLAASFDGGGLALFDLRDSAEDVTVFETSDYTHFEGGFYGQYFAFSATMDGESVFAVLDMETLEQTGGFSSPNPFHVQADENGILVSTENLLVELHPVTGEQRELAYASADITGFARSGGYTLVSLSDGTSAFFDENARLLETREGACDFLALAGDFALSASRDTPSLRVLRLERHTEAQTFAYDQGYLHDEARMSESGNVMLYRYDGFRLCGPDGNVLEEMSLPDSSQVYDQQYRRDADGDYLEVIYNNGTVRTYSAVDGRLLSETQGTPPDGTLDEEFFTDSLRITAPLHGTAAAYDRETGELVRELEKDDYLAYVTQAGEYIVTEYVTSQGTRYGLLLDGNCETLARLPGLCDILPDGTLLFDDQNGNLRQSRIYSVQELTALATKQ